MLLLTTKKEKKALHCDIQFSKAKTFPHNRKSYWTNSIKFSKDQSRTQVPEFIFLRSHRSATDIQVSHVTSTQALSVF